MTKQNKRLSTVIEKRERKAEKRELKAIERDHKMAQRDKRRDARFDRLMLEVCDFIGNLLKSCVRLELFGFGLDR